MTKAAMNCWEALEVLEGIDAGAITADDALSVDAQRHLATCVSCQAALPQRLKWNADLTEAMTAVAVPADLEARLALYPRVQPPGALATVVTPRNTRYAKVLSWVTATVLLLAIIIWVQRSPRQDQLLTRQIVDANIAYEFSSSSKKYSSEQEQPELPMLWRAFFELSPDLIYAFPPEQLKPVAAMVPFEFRHARLATAIRGRLVMIPRARFRDPPAGDDFFNAQPDYIGGFESCVWIEGKWVYLCYVRSGDKSELREFQRLMRDSLNFL